MISCRILPTRRFLLQTLHYPPKSKTLRQRRGVFVLAACLISTLAGAQRIGDLYASDATVKGGVRYTATGLEVDNGSVITAGQHSASVRLARGGQMRICPGTNLTVNSSPKGQELMFAMSAGSLEGEYDLPATADAILTPDFRILISGPAKVNVSITARANGDACIRSRGEDSYVVISELMGDDFYRLKPNEQAIFHPGNVKRPDLDDAASCGCPAPSAVQTADAAPIVPPAPSPQANSPLPQIPVPAVQSPAAPTQSPVITQPSAPSAQTLEPAQQRTPAPTAEQKAAALASLKAEPAVAAAANAAASMPQQPSSQIQVQVDAPMVFRGAGTPADVDVTQTLARVHIEHLPWPQTSTVAPQPPTPSQTPSKTKTQTGNEKKGFFRRLAKALFG